MIEDAARGRRITELRQARGLTQKALCGLLGAGERSVRGWERGQPISYTYLQSLCAALATTQAFVLTGVRDDDGRVPSSAPNATLARVEQLLRDHDKRLQTFFALIMWRDRVLEARLEATTKAQDATTKALEATLLEMRALRQEQEATARSATAGHRQQGTIATLHTA